MNKLLFQVKKVLRKLFHPIKFVRMCILVIKNLFTLACVTALRGKFILDLFSSNKIHCVYYLISLFALYPMTSKLTEKEVNESFYRMDQL
jgi:hypothetical protein